MKLSIIVTTWGVERWVETCRASLRKAVAAARRAGCGLVSEIIEISNGEGVAAARNEGLSKASGDYVWFVDGDDTIAEEALVRLAEVLARHPKVDIVHFECHAVTGVEETYDLTVVRERVRAYRRHARWIIAWNALYRRDFVKRLRFEALVKGEDSLWGRRAFYRAASLVYLPAALYEYRPRPEGADQTRDARHYADAKRAIGRMFVEGLGVRGLRFWVLLDWLRARFRELPAWKKRGGMR